MYLNDAEKAMLDGKRGHARRRCMELLVSLGEIYDAERLIDVRSVHMPGASITGIGEAGLRLVEELERGNTRIPVFATTNPSSMPPAPDQDVGLDAKQIADQTRITKAFDRMGVYACNSCTPYLIGNSPRPGEHVCWGESSALSYANSVLGARTNREGGPTTLASAITGKTPLWGYHLDKNRAGTLLVKVKTRLRGISAYGTLGYFTGKLAERGAPVFEGIPPDVTDDELKMLAAALASSGAVALFHVVGVTGEAPTRATAFRGRKVRRVLEYGGSEEAKTARSLTKTDRHEVEWVVLGCPHFSISEFRQLARLLEGKRVHPDVILWVNTSVPVAHYARRLGYAQVIEAAGAQIVCEVCPCHTPSQAFAQKRGISTIMTNSAKMAHYAAGQFGLLPQYADTLQCTQAALDGKWR